MVECGCKYSPDLIGCVALQEDGGSHLWIS